MCGSNVFVYFHSRLDTPSLWSAERRVFSRSLSSQKWANDGQSGVAYQTTAQVRSTEHHQELYSNARQGQPSWWGR